MLNWEKWNAKIIFQSTDLRVHQPPSQYLLKGRRIILNMCIDFSERGKERVTSISPTHAPTKGGTHNLGMKGRRFFISSHLATNFMRLAHFSEDRWGKRASK